MRENVGKIVKHALVGSKALKDLDGFLRVNLVGILDGNLGYDLDVLSWVRLEHIVHALEGLLFTKFAKEVNDLLLWDGMGVEHDSLDIGHVCVALEGSTVETNLLAHLCNLFSIVLREEIELEDSLGNVWSTHEVDLEDLGLQVSLIGSVALEGLEEEGGAFLDLVEFQENVDDLIDLGLWWTLVSVGDHSGEANSSLWVDRHDLSEDLDKIRRMSSLLAVRHDLVELVGLNESLNDLVRGARLLVDAESHLWVSLSDEVSKFVGHSQLFLLDPVLDQIELILLDNWPGKLDGLNCVQLGCLQEGVEVDENRRWTSSGRQVLELVDGLCVSQKRSWGIPRNGSSSSVVTCCELLVEHKHEEIVGTSKVEPLG